MFNVVKEMDLANQLGTPLTVYDWYMNVGCDVCMAPAWRTSELENGSLLCCLIVQFSSFLFFFILFYLGAFRLVFSPGPNGKIPELLFTNNETNFKRLYGIKNEGFVKDAFHDYIIKGIFSSNFSVSVKKYFTRIF